MCVCLKGFVSGVVLGLSFRFRWIDAFQVVCRVSYVEVCYGM